jgi:PLP dependent protein
LRVFFIDLTNKLFYYMSNIAENYLRFKEIVEDNYKAKLLAVSKNFEVAHINEAYQAGARNFAENRVQELLSKHFDTQNRYNDINWHLIGTLQSNKAKYVTDFVTLIHSVDKYALLQEINKNAKKHERIQECLLQIHIGQELTKFGFSYQEAEEMLQNKSFENLTNIKIIGLMGMATYTDDTAQVEKEFKGLRNFFETLQKYSTEEYPFLDIKELSMGMSSDYKIALDAGSTCVRIGKAIFGKK